MSEKVFSFKSVLLVDDSEIDVLVNRRLMELTSFASQVTVTNSGEEGLHYLREECAGSEKAPDWIFLDMHLPMMSGYDFIEEFKSLPESIQAKSKIIILSVFNKPELLQKVFENSFVVGQLDKPLTQQALHDLATKGVVKFSASS
ncbi:MAG TPA: response regulator [Bacteroidia bacterium]|nr:response regulator [Bacteroidia bacterium]HNP97592.1 response regulator [Bacteroidia bacterium]